MPLRTVGRLVVDDPLKPWVDGWPDQPTLVWGPDKLYAFQFVQDDRQQAQK